MNPVETARLRLVEHTGWAGSRLATLAWWTSPELLRCLGPGLAGLFPDARPTLIAGVQSSGFLLAPLVATHLGAGMLGIQKQPQADGTILLATVEDTVRAGPPPGSSAPGAADVGLATVRGRPRAGDRVLLVDDIVESGAQAAAVRELIVGTGAQWLGVAAMVTYHPQPELGVRALAGIDDLRRPVPG